MGDTFEKLADQATAYSNAMKGTEKGHPAHEDAKKRFYETNEQIRRLAAMPTREERQHDASKKTEKNAKKGKVDHPYGDDNHHEGSHKTLKRLGAGKTYKDT